VSVAPMKKMCIGAVAVFAGKYQEFPLWWGHIPLLTGVDILS